MARAYVSPSAREFAWRRRDLPEAMQAIVDSGRTILGGEVWLVEDTNQNWTDLIPDRSGGPPGVWHWETGPRQAMESWNQYCERTLHESLDAAAGLEVEESSGPEVIQYLWFNVTDMKRDDV